MKEDLKKEIAGILKAEGLDVAEEAAVAAVKAAFAVLVVIVPKVSFGAGAIIIPMIKALEPKIYALLDKIDGVDDEGR